MERIRKVGFLILCTVPLAVSHMMYTESHCKQLMEQANFHECCNMPRLLSDDVLERCQNRSLPPSLPGEPDPLLTACRAECVLNATGILVNHQFLVEEAIKVLVQQVPNGTLLWKKAFEVAARKCYNLQVAGPFYLRDVARNKISSQCIPSSLKFLECTFAIAYRDCPDVHWNYNNDDCGSLVPALNNCRYLFLHKWKI